jgi:hypothetical protein
VVVSSSGVVMVMVVMMGVVRVVRMMMCACIR